VPPFLKNTLSAVNVETPVTFKFVAFKLLTVATPATTPPGDNVAPAEVTLNEPTVRFLSRVPPEVIVQVTIPDCASEVVTAAPIKLIVCAVPTVAPATDTPIPDPVPVILVKPDPLPMKFVALAVPSTSKALFGTDVPIPTEKPDPTKT